jgi:hypothetical protein
LLDQIGRDAGAVLGGRVEWRSVRGGLSERQGHAAAREIELEDGPHAAVWKQPDVRGKSVGDRAFGE